MKKNLHLALLLTLLAFSSACSGGKWHQFPENMPDEIREKNEAILEEHLAVIKDDPFNVDSLFEVAYRYEILGNYKKASKYYLKTVGLSPNYAAAYNNLASMYEKIGEVQAAAYHIKAYYDLNQGTTEAIRDAVRILLSAGEPENAEIALENFIEINTGDDGGIDPETASLIDNLQSQIDQYYLEFPND